MDHRAFCDRLYADALAVPLRVPDAFVESKSEITRDELENHLRVRADAYRQDLSATAAQAERAFQEVSSSFDKGPWRAVNWLTVGAHARLRSDGREMVLRAVRDDPGREILRWRFVSLLLPPGILIAAATAKGYAPPNAVRLLSRSISPDHSVAHNHLHHAAMMSFEELWVSLRLRAFTQVAEFERDIQGLRAFCPGLHRALCPGGRTGAERALGERRPIARARHMAEWADLIRQAFIGRRVLDRHAGHAEPLRKCADEICEAARSALGRFLDGRAKPDYLTPTAYPWPDSMVSLGRSYREANTPSALRRSSHLRKNLVRQEADDERQILARAFTRLRSETKQDADYETLLLQYLRIKTAVFAMLVHPPGEHGLDKFLEHFNQIKVNAPEADSHKPPRPDEPGLSVVATEYRVAPDAWVTTFSQDDEIEEASADHSTQSESAWIIHLKRKEPSRGLPLWAAEINEMKSHADRIVSVLRRDPRQLRMLRGVDICGVEGRQPLWVSAESLKDLRMRSQDIAASRPELRLEPLRLTVHVGEDFRWLTSGVRAVAEPFHWKLIERGDRIGHAMAITQDPMSWWERHEGEVVPVATFDRLLDLAFLATYSDGRNPAQSEWLRLEIERVAKSLWPERKDTPTTDFVETAQELWRRLGGRLTRRLMETPRWTGDKRDEEWLHRYLWHGSVQARADKPIQVKVDDDGNAARTDSDRNERDLLVRARARLIREVARWQVCIESNPTSNLLVGSLDAMAAQDFLRQRPTRVREQGEETLTWTISTDDPITFSTTLADEYAYAWAGMVLRDEKPYDPSYARALLDEAAETSMRMRFTIPRHEVVGGRKTTRQGRDSAHRG